MIKSNYILNSIFNGWNFIGMEFREPPSENFIFRIFLLLMLSVSWELPMKREQQYPALHSIIYPVA